VASPSPVTKLMHVERFFDTNILPYGYDLDAPAKRERAKELIEDAWLKPGRAAISVQVLQEFHVNFVRSRHTQADAMALIEDFSRWQVIDNTLSLFGLGLALQVRWQISLRDSMILAAAQTSGARELLTEDLNHGQKYGGVWVINPFL